MTIAFGELLDAPISELAAAAAALRDSGKGRLQTYSPKVFIPLTQLCRNVCHYCTFAHPPRRGEPAYMSMADVVAVARDGARAGCTEALFTLGDKPERRYAAARAQLATLGHETTIDYLVEACAVVLRETGLLPHVNAGVVTGDELDRLRHVSVSQGLMLESAAERLCARGGPHFGSPDKAPAARLEVIRLAGERAMPFTTGLLIGIGETRMERLDALLAIRDLHLRFGHIQEIIVQNFRAKPGTLMADAPEPSIDELVWTIASARLIFGPDMVLQAPPNLSPSGLQALIDAGIDDWGGVSPVTIDHVNPEAPWPSLHALRDATAAAGRLLVERLPVQPAYVLDAARWLDPALAPSVVRGADAAGLSRAAPWNAGSTAPPRPEIIYPGTKPDAYVVELAKRAAQGDALDEASIARMFQARGPDFVHLCDAADRLREETCGDAVSYVVTRNINYTNICGYKCGFCAFSKGRARDSLRDAPYDLDVGEVARRTREAWDRGAVEICMQGGIHPSYTGETYLGLLRAVRRELPDIHVHAFSPLEVAQGAKTLGLPVADFLRQLQAEGLGSLPGTAAEILDDGVRAELCADKIRTDEWLEIVEQAHRLGIPTTATIMFGHIDRPVHWARHLLRIRALQERTGGITEFVPLPFVHPQAPIYLKGLARKGPTYREAILMHAVARLVLHPVIPNIQVSWTKMGPDGAKAALRAGANDLGGTLMNESITRAAGAANGQEMPPEAMEQLIRAIGREPRQRTTLYDDAPHARRTVSLAPPPLQPVIQGRGGAAARTLVAAN